MPGQGGRGYARPNVRLGQTYRFQDSSHQWQEHTNWHSLSFYGDLSKVALSFDKGENIFVEGTIEQRQFTPKGDGAQRTVHEVVVRSCHLIAAPRGATTKGGAASAPEEPVVQDLPKGAIDREDWPVG